MGHSYTGVGGFGDFTVTKSNPSGNIVRFTVTDSTNMLTTLRMLRAVLADAIDQWIADERTDLNTNGDDDVTGSDANRPGNGFDNFTWDKEGKYAEVTLTSLTNISSSGTITASIPYGDVV